MQISDIDILLRASGYVYHNGSRAKESFIKTFGFNPLKYPRFFIESENHKLIFCNSKFIKFCDNQFNSYKTNMDMLTEVFE